MFSTVESDKNYEGENRGNGNVGCSLPFFYAAK